MRREGEVCDHSAQSWSKDADGVTHCDDCETAIVQVGDRWVSAGRAGVKKYSAMAIRKVSPHSVSTMPDWSHSESWDVFVGQMEDSRQSPTVKGGTPNLHRSAWAPVVLIGHEGDPVKRGLNPRAARYLARLLLEAADEAEELEVKTGWHPAFDTAIVKSILES